METRRKRSPERADQRNEEGFLHCKRTKHSRNDDGGTENADSAGQPSTSFMVSSDLSVSRDRSVHNCTSDASARDTTTVVNESPGISGADGSSPVQNTDPDLAVSLMADTGDLSSSTDAVVSHEKQHEKFTVEYLRKVVLTRDLTSLKMLVDSKSCDLRIRCDNGSSILEKFLQEHLKTSQTFSEIDIAVIKMLLENGAGVSLCRPNGEPPLITATKHGSCELVRLLCKYGANVNVKSANKDAMMIAAQNGRSDIITTLICYNGAVNPSGLYNSGAFPYMHSPLHLALKNGHISCAKLLIEHGAEMNVPFALKLAIKYQDPAYLKFVLDTFGVACRDTLSGNDNIWGYVMLRDTVRAGNTEIVSMLLDFGCSINQTVDGLSPLMNAQSAKMVQLLIQRGADANQKSNVLCCVIPNLREEEPAAVRVLLENGVSVNGINQQGHTPLMIAAKKQGSLDVLQVLVENGADVNAKDRLGDTALFHAIRGRRTENAKFLIESMSNHGVHCGNVEYFDWSAVLMGAVTNEPDAEVLKMLINKGANVNFEDEHGETPLMRSLRYYIRADAMNVLIRNGADVNHCNKGYSALMVGARYCWNQDAVKLLISSGAHINYHDEKGYSAMMIAAQCQNVQVLRTLIELGADVNDVNVKTNETALSILFEKTPGNCVAEAGIRNLLENGARSFNLHGRVLHFAITQGFRRFIPKMISDGLGPADVRPDRKLWGKMCPTFSPISPLCTALLTGSIHIARYLYWNWFLTKFDVTSLTRNRNLRHELASRRNDMPIFEQCLDFLDSIGSQPETLFKLAFVAVSSDVVGGAPNRRDRVNSLPLPTVLKDMLLFKKEKYSLCVT